LSERKASIAVLERNRVVGQRIARVLQEPRLSSVIGWPSFESMPRPWEIAIAVRRILEDRRRIVRSKRSGGTKETADPPGSAGNAISVGTPERPGNFRRAARLTRIGVAPASCGENIVRSEI